MIITAQQIQYNEIHVKKTTCTCRLRQFIWNLILANIGAFYIATVSNAHDIISKVVPFLMTIIKLFIELYNSNFVPPST